MQRIIAMQNIERFIALLATATDPLERRKIEILLASEKQKLENLVAGDSRSMPRSLQ